MIIHVPSSSRFEKGLVYGLYAGSLARRNAARMLEKARRTNMELEERAEGIPPGILEELRGVAAGAGLSLEAVLAINYAEILGGGEECTAAVVSANLSATGAPIVWKNRDMGSRWLQHQVLVLHEGSGDRYGFVAVTTAGHWGVAMGINEKGLAIENTFIFAGKYVNPNPEWGNLWLMRRVLEEADSVEKAYEIISKTRGKYSGSSYLIADTRSAAVVDVVGDEEAIYTEVNEGFAVRTNHWEPVAPRDLWKYEVNKYPEESVKRYEAAYSFLAQRMQQGSIGLGDLIELSRNTANGLNPLSPCRFPRNPGAVKEGVEESTTLSAAIMMPRPEDPLLSTMWAALGNPLAAPYMPVLAAASLYSERSVELRNARRFAEEAPRLKDLPPEAIRARLKEIGEPWLASILHSSEPWLAAENLRELLYGSAGQPVREAGRSYVECLGAAEQGMAEFIDAVQRGREPGIITEKLVAVLRESTDRCWRTLASIGGKRDIAVSSARLFLAVYAALRADIWGLEAHTGNSAWEKAGRTVLEAFNETRLRIAGVNTP